MLWVSLSLFRPSVLHRPEDEGGVVSTCCAGGCLAKNVSSSSLVPGWDLLWFSHTALPAGPWSSAGVPPFPPSAPSCHCAKYIRFRKLVGGSGGGCEASQGGGGKGHLVEHTRPGAQPSALRTQVRRSFCTSNPAVTCEFACSSASPFSPFFRLPPVQNLSWRVGQPGKC